MGVHELFLAHFPDAVTLEEDDRVILHDSHGQAGNLPLGHRLEDILIQIFKWILLRTHGAGD